MPQLGYDMKEGRIVKWLIAEGAPVKRGQGIAEIETDKANVELEAFGEGVLRKIIVPEGQTVPVGKLIGYITAPNEALPAEIPTTAPTAQPSQVPQPTQAQSPASQPAVQQQPSAPAAQGEVRASPLARKLAQDKGVDINRVTGTGPGGRVVEKDVEAYAQQPKATPQPAAPTALPVTAQAPVVQGDRIVELSRMRQAIARLTVASKMTIPHFYVSADVSMGDAMELRRQINSSLESNQPRVSVNDLLIKACTLAVQKYPNFNASFKDNKLEMHGSINIAIAIALEGEGLIVPAVLDCGNKSLLQIAAASKDLIDRAQQQKLHDQEYSAGTFAISNLGMFDIESFIAIIHPPQSAVLAVGQVRKTPVVKGDQIVVGQVMKMTLSSDHRVNDGAAAAVFIAHLKRLLEHPVTLLM